MNPANLLALETMAESAAERVNSLLTSPAATNLRVERIQSPPRYSSDPGFWYDQPDHEWLVLLEGSATLRFQDPDETIDLQRGDHLTIPPHRKHRVERTDSAKPTLWLAVHWEE